MYIHTYVYVRMLSFFKVKIQNFSTLILMIIHVTEYALRIHVRIKHAFCSLMQLASILFACVYICMYVCRWRRGGTCTAGHCPKGKDLHAKIKTHVAVFLVL